MKDSSKLFLVALLLLTSDFLLAQTGAIRINQLGYYPTANKLAVIVNSAGVSTFEVQDTIDNSVVLTGNLSPSVYWTDAGDSVRLADFSAITAPGTYRLVLPGFGESYPFSISGNVMKGAAYASLKSYYYQRCSYELLDEYAGIWARGAGHPDTACVFHSSTGKTGKLSSPGGWYDAGDFGKYVINAGISVGTMLSFYENYSAYFGDGSIHIPESGNGKNDLLDEIKFELDWLKTMQDDDGGVFFKLTTLNFDGFKMPENATATRYVIGKVTASALDFAAMMAMAGRIYQEYDPGYADDCILRAENAWAWAVANPTLYFSNPPDVNTGEYGNGDVTDEFLWAAAELFITTGKDDYRTYLENRSASLTYSGAPWWGGVRPLASLSLATIDNGLSGSLVTTIRNSITARADSWLEQIASNPARIPNFTYNWGSNSGIANIGVGLLYAYIVSADEKYIRGAAECADYLLGKNATGFSFVSSYGYKTPMNFHHRASGSDGIRQPVPGFVSGGPNKDKQDGEAYPFSAPAKSFVDVLGSYASNEVCINWNSPLTVLLAGVDVVLGDGSDPGFEVPHSLNDPPAMQNNAISPKYNSVQGNDKNLAVEGSASDPDGISRVEMYIDSKFSGDSEDEEFSWELEPPARGKHTVTVLAFDKYGLTTEVTNLFEIVQVSSIPGRIEAEDFYFTNGISSQATSDSEGGENILSTDPNDYCDYQVTVLEEGYYRVEFRVAGSTAGEFQVRRSTSVLATVTFEPTGGVNTWATVADTLSLAAGSQKLRIFVINGGWKMNWMDFIKIDYTGTDEGAARKNTLELSPNPFREHLTVSYCLEKPGQVMFRIFDITGRQVLPAVSRNGTSGQEEFSLDLEGLAGEGIYYMVMEQDGRRLGTRKIIRASR